MKVAPGMLEELGRHGTERDWDTSQKRGGKLTKSNWITQALKDEMQSGKIFFSINYI